MNDIKHIVPGLEQCDRKCRKCRWRDGFSGGCMLMGRAVEYIQQLEHDNAEKVVYCKDCLYCVPEERKYMYYGKDKYRCTNRDGLPIVPDIDPMDYCSRGKAKEGAKDDTERFVEGVR